MNSYQVFVSCGVGLVFILGVFTLIWASGDDDDEDVEDDTGTNDDDIYRS